MYCQEKTSKILHKSRHRLVIPWLQSPLIPSGPLNMQSHFLAFQWHLCMNAFQPNSLYWHLLLRKFGWNRSRTGLVHILKVAEEEFPRHSQQLDIGSLLICEAREAWLLWRQFCSLDSCLWQSWQPKWIRGHSFDLLEETCQRYLSRAKRIKWMRMMVVFWNFVLWWNK